MKILNVGDSVKYINPDDPYKKEIKEGIVHGVKTKERPNGDGSTTIIDRTYLIDTGNTIREDVGYIDAPANLENPQFWIDDKAVVQDIVRQPETIEVRIKQ